MFSKLKEYLTRPALYAPGSAPFWSDPHISKGMLDAHLNPSLDSASRNLEFIKKSSRWIAGNSPPDKFPTLLDLGCGPGIYAEQFTQLGYTVNGIDISERSIMHARQSAKAQGLNINYQTGNYLGPDALPEADLVTLIYCDFGVLAPDDRNRLLKSICGLLRPGGHFIFDVFTPVKYIGRPEEQTWEFSQGGFWHPEAHLNLSAFHRYDQCNTYLEQHIVLSKHSLNCYNIWEHVFTAGELERDLETAGFSKLTIFGNIAGADYTPSSETICAVAQK